MLRHKPRSCGPLILSNHRSVNTDIKNLVRSAKRIIYSNTILRISNKSAATYKFNEDITGALEGNYAPSTEACFLLNDIEVKDSIYVPNALNKMCMNIVESLSLPDPDLTAVNMASHPHSLILMPFSELEIRTLGWNNPRPSLMNWMYWGNFLALSKPSLFLIFSFLEVCNAIFTSSLIIIPILTASW